MAVPFGFHRLTDQQLGILAADIPNVINAAVDEALRAHDDRTTRALGIFSFQTTIASQAYENPIEYGELQPLDEHGRALPERSARGDRYTVGLPIAMHGTAVGETWLHRRKLTGQGVADAMANAMRRDLNTRTRQMYSGLFQAADYTFFDEIGGAGDLVVKPLANGDAIRYPVTTSVGVKQDNHLLAQNAPISDAANPLPGAAATIREHPDNTGPVLIFCSTDQAAAIRNLSLYYAVADPNIVAALTNARLGATAPAVPVGEVIGYISGTTRAWVVLWDRLDTIGTGNYLIVMSQNGPRPVAERIDPAVPGFGLADTREDYPYYERQYLRMSGFGAWNRTGAVILQIGAPTYSVPAGFVREN